MLELILLLTSGLLLFYPIGKRQFQLWRWRKQLALDKHSQTYQHLFTSVNGFMLSREARRERDAMEYTYGEIDFLSFIALLSLVNPNQETVFYDLGSGIGTAVLACALVFPVKKSCGIERFALLHQTALAQQLQLRQLSHYKAAAAAIHLIHDDFLKVDLHDATLIFINATGFFGEIWQQLNQKLQHCCQKATIITTSKPLSSTCFKVVKTTRVQMSWGMVWAYIHIPM